MAERTRELLDRLQVRLPDLDADGRADVRRPAAGRGGRAGGRLLVASS